MVMLFFVETTCLGISLKNLDDHQPLFIYGQVGFHVTSMSHSHSFPEFFTLVIFIFCELV